jgi:hypothetical protein
MDKVEASRGSKTLYLVLLLVLALKLGLANWALFAFQDEGRYSASFEALGSFRDGRFADGIDAIFATQGRPGEVIIRMVPALVEFTLSKMLQCHVFDPRVYWPTFVFNWCIFVGVVWQVVQFGTMALRSRDQGLVMGILYASLLNGQIYIRHALPYDSALLLLLGALNLLTRHIQSGRWSSIGFPMAGILSFLGLATYPGYFPFALVLIGVALFQGLRADDFQPRLRAWLGFAGGGLLGLGSFEGLSRLGTRSFLRELMGISGAITQGSFDEMLSFPVRYLLEVEGAAGVIVLLAILASVGLCLRLGWKNGWRTVEGAGLPLLLALTALGGYACMGYFLHSMVFYGRLLHEYLPLFCLSIPVVAVAVAGAAKVDLRRILVTCAVLCVVLSVWNLARLRSVDHPGSAAWKLARSLARNEVETICEFDEGFPHIPAAEPLIWRPEKKEGSRVEAVLVNGCMYHPVPESVVHVPYPAPLGFVLRLESPHFLSLAAYTFEGYTPLERQQLKALQPKVRVYRRAP